MSINGTQRLNGSVSGASPLSGNLSVGGKGGNVDPATIESLIQQYLAAHPPKDGQDGKSAYEIALDNGFEGTEEEWLESLIGADGEQGEPGVSGVYYGSGECPEGYDVQIDPEGGAINLIEAPSKAEVGQMLVVKAVDENGVPTEWEVSDVASDGGLEGFELIDTIDFATDEMAKGVALKEYIVSNITEIVLVWKNMTNATTSISTVAIGYFNEDSVLYNIAAKTGKSGSVLNGYTYIKVLENCGTFVEFSQGAITGTNYSNCGSGIGLYNLLPVTQPITKFTIGNNNITYYANGGIIEIWVR